jgi:hypothetical protein
VSHAAPVLVLVSLLLTAIALPGCAAALAVPALGSAAASGSANALARAGTSSVSGGSVYRTFDAPLDHVYAVVETTLSRLEFPGPEEQVHQERMTLRTSAIERHVRIDLQPITSTLTQVSVTVAINFFQKDTATAATLVDLVAEALGPAPRALSRPAP